MKVHQKVLSALLSFTILFGIFMAVPDTAMAINTEDIIYFEEDFTSEEYTVDTPYNMIDFQDICKGSVATTSLYWDPTYTIKKVNNKNYLSTALSASAAKPSGGYYFKFDEDSPFTKGNLVVEMKIRTGNDLGMVNREFFAFRGSSSAETFYTLGSVGGKALSTSSNSTASKLIYKSGDDLLTEPMVDSDGFWNIRVMLSRESETDNWNIVIYDANNGNVLKNPVDTGRDYNIQRVTFTDLNQYSGKTGITDITDLKVYTPKDVYFEEQSAYDAQTKKLVYTASEELIADSISEETISVLDPNGYEVAGVSAVLAENGVDIELYFEYGLPEDGTYTVIADGVMTARYIPVVYEVTFEGEKADIPFEITGITPAEGNIYRDAGSISVGFTHEIHPSAASFISFTKANGDPINGGYEVAVNGRTAILSFGKLSLGDYILTIDSDLASEDEKSVLGEKKIYNFTAVENALEGEDYTSDDYEIGTVYSGTELAALSDCLTYGANGDYLIEEVNGDKFVTMSVDEINKGPSMSMRFNETIEDGILEASLKLKGTAGTLSRGIFAVYGNGTDGASTTTRLLSMDAGTAITVSSDSTSLGGSFCSDAPVNKDDFFNIKLRLSSRNTEADWTVEVFDLNNSERLFYSAILPREKLAVVTRIMLCNMWPIATAELERTVSVSEAWYKYTECISIIDADTDVLPTADSISFRFDDDISYDNITAWLVAEDETQIDCEYVYDEELRELTLMPKSFLDWSTSYKLVLEGANVKDYTFSTAPAESSLVSKSITYITDSENTDTKPLEGSFDVKADVKINASGKKEFLLVAIAYDAIGYPIEIEEKSFENINQSASDYVVLEDVSALKCNSVKCFLWQKTEKGYRQVK